MSITELAIKRPLLITVIFVTAILFGWMSYRSLSYNLLPKFEANIITIQTIYRGASSEEVQSSVTKPIEEAISSVEGIDHISATSQEGVSVLIVQLKPGVSTMNAQRDAERRINLMKSQLPDDVDDPAVNRFSTDEIPVLRISAFTQGSQTELYDLIEQKIKPLLSNVAGVGNIRLIGGNKREIKINLDNDKMQSYGISPVMVNQAIATSNLTYPAGNIENSEGRFTLRIDAKVTQVEELRSLILREGKDGSRIYLRDIATVTDAQTEPNTINRINGNSGIGIEINKQADANAVEVSRGVKKKLEEIKKTYADKGFDYEIAIDQSIYTLASASAVVEDLFLAVFIVAIVMLLFLHSVRSAAFVLVALPSAMIPTFALMYAFGFSLNLMTLMALSLVVGILVDDSIVILENIIRHMEMGKDKRTASIEGRAEIGFTAIAITLVDVVVFVPMALAGGMIGNILREFSLVVVFSTLMSLVVSFTLTPLLASRFGKLEHLNANTAWGRINIAFENGITAIKNEYGNILQWALGHKRWIFIGTIILFIGSFALVPAGFIGAAFIADSDRGEFSVQLELASQATIYQTNQAVQKVEEILLKRPEVVKVFSNVGTQTGQTGGSSSVANLAEIAVQLVDKKQRKLSSNEFGNEVRAEIEKIPGIKVTILPTSITGQSQAPIQIAIKGTEMDKIWEAAKLVRQVVASTAGTDYVQFSTKSPKSEIVIKLRRDKIANLGLSPVEIGTAVQLAFRGSDQTKYKDKGEEYAINLVTDKGDRQDLANIRNFTVRTSRGANIRLEDVADIEEKVGQSVLERYDRLNSIKITATTVGRPAGSVVDDIKKGLAKVKLPDGVIVDYQGQAQQQADAFGSLGTAMLIGVLLVYLIMVALYESTIYPFVVLFSLPLAFIGSLIALALTMQPLTIFAIIGLIMLMGLVAKNAILLVDFTNHLKTEGRTTREALIEAGQERLRPILMTTVAMIVGMLPIALASGAGAEVKNGMAWVIIGGLTSSLILTLVVVPCVYVVIDSLKERVGKFFSKRRQQNTTNTHATE